MHHGSDQDQKNLGGTSSDGNFRCDHHVSCHNTCTDHSAVVLQVTLVAKRT